MGDKGKNRCTSNIYKKKKKNVKIFHTNVAKVCIVYKFNVCHNLVSIFIPVFFPLDTSRDDGCTNPQMKSMKTLTK